LASDLPHARYARRFAQSFTQAIEESDVMRSVAVVLVVVASVILALTWIGYPLWLRLKGGAQSRALGGVPHAQWPSVTIVVVVRNAEFALRQVLQNLLALAYPTDRRQILVVSDASRDFTDAVARLFADKGVALLRTSWPRGSGTALNIARRYVRSDLTVVVDPAARLRPWSLAALVAPFSERSVGVVYGREVGAENGPARRGQDTKYWEYESWLRDLETRVFGTVSARGSLYAVRTPLFRAPVPAWLNPDFGMTLTAREHGYRAVYQQDAEAVVTRHAGRPAYERTVQAVSRDISTLLFKRHLLNPRHFGSFAWMLLGHKLGHWLTPWAALLGLAGLALLAPTTPSAAGALVGLAFGGAVALAAAQLSRRRAAGRPSPLRAFTHAVAFAHGSLRAVFEPAELRPATFPPLSRPAFRAHAIGL
jgi:hypothetical protein